MFQAGFILKPETFAKHPKTLLGSVVTISGGVSKSVLPKYADNLVVS